MDAVLRNFWLTIVGSTWSVCEHIYGIIEVKVSDINHPWVGGCLFHHTMRRVARRQVVTSLKWSTSRKSIGDCKEGNTAQNDREHGHWAIVINLSSVARERERVRLKLCMRMLHCAFMHSSGLSGITIVWPVDRMLQSLTHDKYCNNGKLHDGLI